MVAQQAHPHGGLIMVKLKLAAASLFSLGVIAMTPIAAHADTCNQCFGGCIDAYGDDNSESGYHALSQCFNSCYDDSGSQCMQTI